MPNERFPNQRLKPDGGEGETMKIRLYCLVQANSQLVTNLSLSGL
jgi:hypothetical protein